MIHETIPGVGIETQIQRPRALFRAEVQKGILLRDTRPERIPLILRVIHHIRCNILRHGIQLVPRPITKVRHRMRKETWIRIHINLVPIILKVTNTVRRPLLVVSKLSPPPSIGGHGRIDGMFPMRLGPPQVYEVRLHSLLGEIIPGVTLVVMDEAIPCVLGVSQQTRSVAFVGTEAGPSGVFDGSEAVVVPCDFDIAQFFLGDVLGSGGEGGEGFVAEGRGWEGKGVGGNGGGGDAGQDGNCGCGCWSERSHLLGISIFVRCND
mmetsp:Transcript_31337/g.58107  ORF Transcript_31337/g.58107 Transcript_31337/m.58107 type:complete len:265 (+) Transcript_31337:607-1401(+)